MVDVRFVDQARRDLASLLSLHPELEEDDVLRQDSIEAETGALELIDKLIQAEREARYLSEGLALEYTRLSQRAERFKNRREALRKYIMQIMEAANLKKVERPAATVSISAGRPKVIVTEPDLLPDYYCRIKREPNKDAIGKALREGLERLPGVTLSNPETVLRIS
jgi:hypothetical protein